MKKENNYNYSPLIEPIIITEQEWPEGTLPLVHTRTMSYMHENYIRDCIEGILMQKTTFPVQVLIHDDASADDTADIVREYELKYPNLIKAYYQTENSYTKKDKRKRRLTFSSWRIGKYEALCEGDDYWTDPLKLQKQFDFLENNEEFILCTHNHSTKYVERDDATDKVKYDHSFSYDLNFYFDNQITPTLTSFFRNIFRDFSYLAKENIFSDFFLFFELLKHGKGYYMVDNMATYRVHNQGVCSGLSEEQKILNHIIMFKHLHKYNSWLFQIRPQIARYYLIHFNYTLRVKKEKWPMWSDLINYFKYKTGFFELTITFLLYIPLYLIRYWLPNVLSFSKNNSEA